MQEVTTSETVAFFRGLGGVGSDEPASMRARSARAREILENCYYPHITKEARRGDTRARWSETD
jgi:hypothetical protein